jgi:hypothetical protein
MGLTPTMNTSSSTSFGTPVGRRSVLPATLSTAGQPWRLTAYDVESKICPTLQYGSETWPVGIMQHNCFPPHADALSLYGEDVARRQSATQSATQSSTRSASQSDGDGDGVVQAVAITIVVAVAVAIAIAGSRR